MSDKPPTQTLGVTGIAAASGALNTPPPVDWGRLAHLPPFQIYAAEQMRSTGATNALQVAQDFVRQRGVGPELLAAYTAWHAAQGRWPGETPLGEVGHA